MGTVLVVTLNIVQSLTVTAVAIHPTAMSRMPVAQTIEVRASCKQVASCEEAVILWCNGYRRADADGDGIPCENVCSSKEEVDRIRAQIGC